jgi:RNA polymerase sigma-70 factor (ECF subfamily)
VETSKKEAQWVLRAQCHDREALDLLLRSIQPSLRRYLTGLVGASHADDVLQDVFVVVCRKLAWLQIPGLFRPWAFRIASRVGFRHLKKERRRLERAEEDTAILDEMPAAPDRPVEELLQTLLTSDALSPASRAVLVLHFQEDMSLAEVAAVLEIPLGTVKSRLAFGLAALRKQLFEKRSL